jgi:hypothetical protein
VLEKLDPAEVTRTQALRQGPAVASTAFRQFMFLHIASSVNQEQRSEPGTATLEDLLAAHKALVELLERELQIGRRTAGSA